MAYKRVDEGNGRWSVHYGEEDYLDSIEQYRGTEWYDQLAANPYLTDGNSYHANWAESSILEGILGDYSRRENFYAEMARNRDEYKAEILKKIQEAQHNSTQEQVARDAAAGLNPDLTGPSTSGQITAAPQDENPPSAPEPLDPGSAILGPAGSIGQLASNLFHGVFDFGRMIQQFHSAGLDNDLKELSLFDKTTGVVNSTDVESETYTNPELSKKATDKGYSLNSDGQVIGPDGNIITGEGKIDEDDPDVLNSILDTINASIAMPKVENEGLISANKLFRSPRLRRFVNAVRDNYGKNSLGRRELRETRKEKILQAHKGQAEVIGDTFYDTDPVVYGTQIADFVESVDKKVRKAEKGIKEAMERSAKAQAAYDEEYYEKDENGNVVVAEADRNAKVAEDAMIRLSSSVDSIVDEEIDGFNEQLKSTNTWWSTALRMLLPQLRNGLKENYIHDLMSKFNFGKTETTTSSKQGGVTTTTKQIK